MAAVGTVIKDQRSPRRILINPLPLLSRDVTECSNGGWRWCAEDIFPPIYCLSSPLSRSLSVVSILRLYPSLLMRAESVPGAFDGVRGGVSVLISIDINLINLNLMTPSGWTVHICHEILIWEGKLNRLCEFTLTRSSRG